MNDATREMIEQAKAKRAEQEAAAIAKRNAKEQAKVEKLKRIDEHMQQRAMEKEAERLRIRASNLQQSYPSNEPVIRRKPLSQDKLASVGQRIEGSSLVRDFCVECGEAMRVVDAGRPNTCLDCRPTGCPGERSGTATRSDIEYHGGRFNSAEW